MEWNKKNGIFNNKKEVLIHAPIWMKLENVIFSERSQTQKVACCIIQSISYETPKIDKSTETECRVMVAKG